MPVLDTEVIFGLNPRDRRHRDTLRVLKELQEQNLAIYAPDTAVYEFQLVLRGLGRKAAEARAALLALRRAFSENRIKEAATISTAMLVQQCEVESTYHLSYFDSMITASTLTLDGVVVSDDTAFDSIPNLKRIPLRLP